MPQKKIIGIIVLTLLLGAGSAFAQSNNQKGQKVYVLTDNPAIKAALGVEHEFSGVFSTKVSAKSKALAKMGIIKTEPVQIYEITGRPVCGDGKCQGRENTETCPEDCKDTVEPDPEPEPEPGSDRACLPTEQMSWGVGLVGGGTGGSGVTVAVLDTGVYRDHLDLKNNVIDCKDTTLDGGVVEGCFDRHGHGTHVAGTILANGGDDGRGIMGVAPEAKLMAMKVCGDDGYCYDDDVVAAIVYATNKGANIISMSLGADGPSPYIEAAIDNAVDNGVLVVAAAGNDGPAIGSIDYPGAYANVVAVGAIDVNENVAKFSSRGVNDGDYIVESREVELGAPSVSVQSAVADGCYGVMSGTSMATPHVAGLAAKLWQVGGANDTRNHLHSIAKDIGLRGDDTATGFGLPITR